MDVDTTPEPTQHHTRFITGANAQDLDLFVIGGWGPPQQTICIYLAAAEMGN